VTLFPGRLFSSAAASSPHHQHLLLPVILPCFTASSWVDLPRIPGFYLDGSVLPYQPHSRALANAGSTNYTFIWM